LVKASRFPLTPRNAIVAAKRQTLVPVHERTVAINRMQQCGRLLLQGGVGVGTENRGVRAAPAPIPASRGRGPRRHGRSPAQRYAATRSDSGESLTEPLQRFGVARQCWDNALAESFSVSIRKRAARHRRLAQPSCRPHRDPEAIAELTSLLVPGDSRR
jgi:hypothetical protein